MLPFRPQLDPDIGHGYHVAGGQQPTPAGALTPELLEQVLDTGSHQSVSEDGSVTADGGGGSPLRRNNTGTRSRRGCWTCRDKKAKKRCDEEKPACGRCRRMNLVCDYTPRPSLAERRRQQALLDAQQREHAQPQESRPFGPEAAAMQMDHVNQQQHQQYHHHQQHQQQPHQQQQYFHPHQQHPQIQLQQHHQQLQLLQHRRTHNQYLSPSQYATSNASSDPGSPLSVVRLSSTNEVGASSIVLGPREHESIRFFRTVFAKAHHTKNPDYSLFSIMFRIAQDDPMVMHMVLSLGGRAMDLRRPSSSSTAHALTAPTATGATTTTSSEHQHQRQYTPHLYHYSAALRCMADTVCLEPGAAAFDMDAILTALWLMCIYEQQFGDAECQGYANHLMGAASLLQHQEKSLRSLRPPHLVSTYDYGDDGADSEGEVTAGPEPTVLVKQIPEHRRHLRLSLYSARILVWLSLHDSAAATSGVGGHLNTMMYTMLRNQHSPSKSSSRSESSHASPSTFTAQKTSPQPQPQPQQQPNHHSSTSFLSTILPSIPSNPIDTFRDLYKYSNPLYRAMWGDAYPQAELLDDVENRNVFVFLANTNQLRFLVAQLAEYHDPESNNDNKSERGGSGRGSDTDQHAVFAARAAQVDAEIRRVGYESTELLEVAAGLSAETDNSHRLVANIRTIVPLYYAVILDFLRVVDLHEHSSTDNGAVASNAAERKRQNQQQQRQQLLRDRRRQRALGEIMTLARQTHRHGGDELLTKIAWPLFAAALELPHSVAPPGSEEGGDRDWIVQRFGAFAAYGDNFARARRFLETRMLPLQDRLGTRCIDWRRVMREGGEVFILGI